MSTQVIQPPAQARANDRPCLLYFIPEQGRNKATKDDLNKHGIGYAFESRWHTVQVRNAVEGENGLIVADINVPLHRVGYYRDTQTWQQVVGSAAWVGRYTADKIEPKHLVRAKQLDGYLLTLRDGNSWMIPVARGANIDGAELYYVNRLNRTLSCDDDGKWMPGDVVPEQADLWDVAVRHWEAKLGRKVEEGDEPGTVEIEWKYTDDEMFDACVVALSTNYRVGKTEVARVLNLLDVDAAIEILDMVVDMPTVEEYLKKKLDGMLGDLSTTNGRGASAETTAPASPT